MLTDSILFTVCNQLQPERISTPALQDILTDNDPIGKKTLISPVNRGRRGREGIVDSATFLAGV